jgi:MurNAc alpha-1-phosphate uridylyltransferase
MSLDVSHAMVLAAGLGLRMRPLTLTKPKPLVEVAGKPLIAYAFGKLGDVGTRHVIVNVHHLPEQIEAWAKQQREFTITISDERREILDTGGGIAHALPHLGKAPFFVLNSDTFWCDGKVPALQRLMDGWNSDTMDCLLLLCPLPQTVGYDGKGDFILDRDRRVSRASERTGEALVYAGAYLVHPRLFAEVPVGKFSMNVLWDKAIAAERLFGVIHDGLWIHVGTPDAIAPAAAALQNA